MNEHNPIAKNQVKFMLNDKEVYAHSKQTIWQAAHKQGVEIPHLCYRNDETYRADGNCRACMVQIEGERTLAASCQRKVSNGMVITTDTDRVKNSQKLVMELLLSDHPDKEIAHDDSSHFWQMAETHALETSRFPSRPAIKADNSHPAIAVNMDACIQCGLC
ncbi:MAG: 2Fe-2S iron-sulfur cluster-binding protein, partial [Alphaproteobacteria bacterium]